MPVLGRRIVGLRAGWGRLLCALGLEKCDVCRRKAVMSAPCPKGNMILCADCAREVLDILEEVQANMQPDGASVISAYSKREPR